MFAASTRTIMSLQENIKIIFIPHIICTEATCSLKTFDFCHHKNEYSAFNSLTLLQNSILLCSTHLILRHIHMVMKSFMSICLST